MLTEATLESASRTIAAQQEEIAGLKAQVATLSGKVDTLAQSLAAHLQFPRPQHSFLRRSNAVTANDSPVSFFLYKKQLFGVISMSRKGHELLEPEATVTLRLQFENGSAPLIAACTVHQTRSELALLSVAWDKDLASRAAVLSEAPAVLPPVGTRLATYAGGRQLVLGHITGEGLTEAREVPCQLPITEKCAGALVVDESMVPVGVCVGGEDPIREGSKGRGIDKEEVINMLPLALRLAFGTSTARVLSMSEIVEEFERRMQREREEEAKREEQRQRESLQARLANSAALPLVRKPVEDEKAKSKSKTEEDRTKFVEFDDDEVKKAKDMALVEEFIDLDLVHQTSPTLPRPEAKGKHK